jgi:hypothetical protein
MGVSLNVLVQSACQDVSDLVREGDALSFELVRQNEICFPQEALVLWYFILRDVQFPVVTHYRVEHCLRVSRRHSIRKIRRDAPQKKLPGFVPALNLMSLPILPTDRTASADGT